MFEEVYKNSKCSHHILKDLVVEDKEDAVRDSEGEKNICNSIRRQQPQ